MAKDALFRNSIGGYNKEDVTKYIEELNVQYTDRGNELESEIKQLKKELEVIPSLKAEKERAEKLSNELEILKKENSDLSEAISAQGDELDAKKNELASISEKCTLLEGRVSVLSAENERLLAAAQTAKADFDDEKARISDKQAELDSLIRENNAAKASLEEEKDEFDKRVDDILSQIQSEAKDIIDKANETAQLIIKDAKKKAEEAGTKSYSQKDYSQYTASAKKRDGYFEKLDSHRSKMDSFFAAITKTLRGEGK